MQAIATLKVAPKSFSHVQVLWCLKVHMMPMGVLSSKFSCYLKSPFGVLIYFHILTNVFTSLAGESW